ncbi:MAG: YebC/PmpR family DNA-binding transcriptional regulator [Candidatus Berkelbacteria bacterium]|nr:YebC/PmpR family DNA-binding transcriptional regulator [Candidatus Berkelbacteria bacterium]
MSGHSKWATTKHKKALVDAKRSASFTKLANVVTIAARNGGDPTMNFQLRLAIDRAKAASMPKENIDRALRRAQGKLGDELSEVIYEGYGPGGVAVLIQCLTDNRQRTVGNVRAAFNKFGGSLAESGSVAYLFEKKGQIIIENKSEIRNPNDETKKEDYLEEKIIESGADDFHIDDDSIIVYTQVSDLQSVAKYLEDADIKLESSQLTYVPKTVLEIPTDKQSSLEKLIDVLESDDDVSEVYVNI